MAEPIKLQEADFKKLQVIQQKYQEKVFQFGQLYLERITLDAKFKQLAEVEH